jgi:hypothetical protein
MILKEEFEFNSKDNETKNKTCHKTSSKRFDTLNNSLNYYKINIFHLVNNLLINKYIYSNTYCKLQNILI